MGIGFLIGKTGHQKKKLVVSAKVGEILPKQSCVALGQSNFSVTIENPRNNSYPCLLYSDNNSQYPEKGVKEEREPWDPGNRRLQERRESSLITWLVQSTGNNKSSCKWKDGRAPKNYNQIPEGGGLLKIGYKPGAID